MKLLIKQDDKYAEIFRADFYKSRLKSVIGKMLLFDYLEAFIPTGINFHSHFTYFEDGNYHFSIKYFDVRENLYIDRKTFYNHIATHKNTESDFRRETEVSYERRDKIPNNPLDMFMRTHPTPPWSSEPLNHHFSTFSMHADGDYTNKFQWKDTKDIKEEDLVVNFKDYKDHTINFGAVLYNKGNPAFELIEKPAYPHYLSKTIESDNRIIQFSMITTFNKADTR